MLPVHQLLVYPPMIAWFFKHYGGDPKSPYALPMKAPSLKGLPAATIIAAEIDSPLSEGTACVDRLKNDGVTVSYKGYVGVTHEFFLMGAVVPAARDSEQFAADALEAAFAQNTKQI